MLTPKVSKGRTRYRDRQQCRRAMDNLSSMRDQVEALPDGDFKRMLLDMIEKHRPFARPPRPHQERIRR